MSRQKAEGTWYARLRRASAKSVRTPRASFVKQSYFAEHAGGVRTAGRAYHIDSNTFIP